MLRERPGWIDRAQRRLAAALVVLALVVAGIPLTASAATDPSFTFSGGGYGHSVGMSQFGAYGMSRQGYSWQEIMQHYFTGASPATVDPALAAEPIWVSLTQEQSSLTLTVKAIGANPVSAKFTSSAGKVTAKVGQTATVSRRSDGTCRVSTPNGTLDGPCTIDVEADGWTGSPATALVLGGCSLVNWNLPGGSQLQPCTYARGGLRIRPDNNTNTVDLSVEIDMEDYVLGISEMPYFWGTTGGQAALEAQAVAARSYAYARVIQRGDPSSRPWCWCQLYDTSVDQNYVGWGHGTQEWVDAVAATAGQVMTHPSRTIGGKLVPIETFYSSSTFGWTEDSENGFTAYVPYLRSVDDHWAVLPEVGNSNATWTRTMSGSALAAALPGMGSVTGLSITKCSTTGAALEITFSGAGGPRTYKTRDLRGLLSLRSMQIVSVTTPNGVQSCPPAPGTTTTTTVPTTTTTVPDTATTTTVPDTTTTVPDTTTTTVPDTTTTVPPTTTTTTTTTVPATTTTTTLPSCLALEQDHLATLLGANDLLREGSTGQAVRELERFLAAMGYGPAKPNQRFSSRTSAAVRAFQDDRGLLIDGIVGSRTRGEIALISSAAVHVGILETTARLLASGTRGTDVQSLQHLLAALGFDPGPADGIYGYQTTAAVKSFQKAKRLLVDGLFGSQSRGAMAGSFGLGATPCR